MKERNIYLDMVKGLAIFLVVWGHCIQFGTKLILYDSYYDDFLYQFIYSFHMPLFMLISGYFFFNSTKKLTIYQNIENKITHIIIPAISGGIIYFIINSFGNVVEFNISGLIPPFFYHVLFQVWFLWAVFNCCIVILLNRKISNDNYIIYYVLILLSFCFPKKYNLHLYVYMFPYFLVGYLWSKHDCTKKLRSISSNLRFGVALTIILLYIVFFHFYSKEDFIYTSGTCILKDTFPFFRVKQLWINLYRYGIGFLGSASLLILIDFLVRLKIVTKESYISKYLSFLGKQTLGIYIFSGILTLLLFNLFKEYIYTTSSSCIVSLIETLVILLVTKAVIIIISRYKISRYLLLGKK